MCLIHADSEQTPVVAITVGEHWGPVPIEFVIHGVYGPDAQNGSQDFIAKNAPQLLVYEGRPADLKSYHVTGSRAGVSVGPAAANTVILQLDQL